MRYKFIRCFSQYEKETMTEDARIHITKQQAVRELAKDLMTKATIETDQDDSIKIIIDI